MSSNLDSGTRCPQTGFISPNEALVVGISFKGKLRAGETLSGSPTVTISPSDPTLSDTQRNTAEITLDGEVCAINEAVLVKLSGCTVNTDYVLTARCATNASTQTKEATCDIRCRS
jgi:hypothetical protein